MFSLIAVERRIFSKLLVLDLKVQWHAGKRNRTLCQHSGFCLPGNDPITQDIRGTVECHADKILTSRLHPYHCE
jgi:hypothetical protein